VAGPSPVCSISSGIADLAPPSTEKDVGGESNQQGMEPSSVDRAVQELATGTSGVAPPSDGADAREGGEK